VKSLEYRGLGEESLPVQGAAIQGGSPPAEGLEARSKKEVKRLDRPLRGSGEAEESLPTPGMNGQELGQEGPTDPVAGESRTPVGRVLQGTEVDGRGIGLNLRPVNAQKRAEETGLPLLWDPAQPLKTGTAQDPEEDGLDLIIAVVSRADPTPRPSP